MLSANGVIAIFSKYLARVLSLEMTTEQVKGEYFNLCSCSYRENPIPFLSHPRYEDDKEFLFSFFQKKLFSYSPPVLVGEILLTLFFPLFPLEN